MKEIHRVLKPVGFLGLIGILKTDGINEELKAQLDEESDGKVNSKRPTALFKDNLKL